MILDHLTDISTGLLAQSWLENVFFRDAEGATYSGAADQVFMFIWWLSAISFVGLMVPTFYWTIKYRRRPGKPAPVSPAHNTPLEITWTVIPSVVLVALFFVGFWVYADQQVAEDGSMNLDLTAQKWSWSITYANGASSTETTPLGAKQAPVFIVPEDQPILLQMTSTDVIHSFWVPDFRMKVDVFPNRYTSYWFRTEPLAPGDQDNPDLPYPNREHWVFCAEYCGDDHSEMAAVLRVVPREQFEAWFDQPYSESMAPIEIGRLVYNAKGCNACHTLDGSAGTGPTWKNLYGYEFSYRDGSSIVADVNHIRESIYDPGKYIRNGYDDQMASYQGRINTKEMNGLLALMRSLSDRGGSSGPAGQGGTGEGGSDSEGGGGS